MNKFNFVLFENIYNVIRMLNEVVKIKVEFKIDYLIMFNIF